MARRTKAQIAQDNAVDNACQKYMVGYQINVMDLGKISTAGHNAAIKGENIEEAVKKAVEQFGQKAD